MMMSGPFGKSERLLRQLGYGSLLFATAEAFEKHSDFQRALCVIFDINLNDKRSGIDLRLALKAAGCSVPVIYMTGNDDPTVHHAALESGCLAYLTKPFSANSLVELLERASGLGPFHRQRLGQTPPKGPT